MPEGPFHGIRLFIAEIRRRRVLRVAFVYVIVGWVVVQAAELLVPQLLLPDWIVRAVLLIVLLGFPIALVLAWAFEITPEGVRLTEPGTTERSATEPTTLEPGAGEPPPGAHERPPGTHESGPGRADREAETRPVRRRRAGISVGVVLLVLLAAAALYLVPRWLHRSQARRARALIPRIERLAQDDSYPAAFRLAVRAERSLKDDTILERLWPEISDRLTVTSEPPGARVLARPLPGDPTTPAAPDTTPPEFRLLGTTPVDDLRIARTLHLLRIEKQGYAPVERLASDGLQRAERILASLPRDSIGIHVTLIPSDEAPDDMVFVPGGEYQLVTPDLPRGLRASLDDYFIDRYEVSNARFREFVTGGGYTNPNLWPSPLVADGDTLAFTEAMSRLVDRTGLPGPRGWISQEPPPDRDDHPVTGVSWYEAAAYCAFRGERLPSVFQWEKAARDGRITHAEGVIMPWGYASPEGHYQDRANFAGDGTVPVDAYPFGISPYGAYGMAGNVKEWTANPIHDGRAVTGGSWADPMYVFSEFGSFDPFDSSNTIGFRCARVRARDARARRDQGTFALNVDERTPIYQPVDSETFQALLSHYRYDPRPLQPQVLDSVETPDWVRLRLSYAGPGDQRVLAYLWLPKSAPPPYQTLLFVPGADVFYGVTLARSAERWLAPLVRSGRAIFSVVMKGMTEREWGRGYEPPDPNTVRFRDEMVRQATEMRLGLDYLQTRRDIDMDRLAYVGLSWGAGSHLVYAAVDDRFDAVIFIGGGIDERVKPNLPAADNVNFAPYIKPPKLLLNGRRDEEHPWFTRGLPLWNLLRQPKQLVLVEDAGHIPPPEARIPAINRFLDGLFGSPTGRTVSE